MFPWILIYLNYHLKIVFLRDTFFYQDLFASHLLEEVLLLSAIALQPKNRLLLVSMGATQSILQIVKFSGVRNIDTESNDPSVRDYVLLCLFHSLSAILLILLPDSTIEASYAITLGDAFRATAFAGLSGALILSFLAPPLDSLGGLLSA